MEHKVTFDEDSQIAVGEDCEKTNLQVLFAKTCLASFKEKTLRKVS